MGKPPLCEGPGPGEQTDYNVAEARPGRSSHIPCLFFELRPIDSPCNLVVPSTRSPSNCTDPATER